VLHLFELTTPLGENRCRREGVATSHPLALQVPLADSLDELCGGLDELGWSDEHEASRQNVGLRIRGYTRYSAGASWSSTLRDEQVNATPEL